MSDVKISIVASANRIKWWPRFLDSLKNNKVSYEVIFVGNVAPDFDTSKYPEFRHIHATVKPCQCYQIGFWASKGELIHWTADDADYNEPSLNCPNSFDIAYRKYREIEELHDNDGKTAIAMNPCEDGGWPQRHFHFLFGGCTWSPRMAPFALVPRKYLVDPDKGYDRQFVSGQCENSIIMDVYADGGRVEVCYEATLYVHHRQVHHRNPATGKEMNDFRRWYPQDRERLEQLWIKEGYGHYEKLTSEQLQKAVHISNVKLFPHEPFIQTDDVCTVTQGRKGQWL